MISPRVSAALVRPVDVASVAFFRVAFGIVMLWEVKRYFDHGWIERYWLEPGYHFTYPLFEWVRPWPGDGMYLHFYALGVLSLFIALGFLYRLSAALFFLGFTYTFLLEQARYLNHFYLVILLSFLMIFVPAHRCCSLDARLRPRLRADRIPAWGLALPAGQMAVVYVFGGIAKVNADWLRGEPLRAWLGKRTDFPLIGSLFTEEWVVYAFSYGGLLLDLLAAPLLLWRRTRPAMFATLCLFHFLNDRLFSIGIFPWLALAATTLFFPPDWPRRLFRVAWERPSRSSRPAWVGGLALGVLVAGFRREFELVPVAVAIAAGMLLGWSVSRSHEASDRESAPEPLPAGGARRVVAALVVAWFALQVAIPLRHFLIPGDVSWTEEGHNFSWHMKLRSKTGSVRFRATDPSSGRSWIIDPRDRLTRWQYRKMATRPHLIHQFARHLASSAEERGLRVHAIARASLNGRKRQPLVDPAADLASEPIRLGAAPWIEPLLEP